MLRALLVFTLAAAAAAQTQTQTQPQTQTPSGDELTGVVILARHGVRAPIESETRSSAFNAEPWPAWPVEPGVLTPHGIDALKRMGEFYRQRYASLLTGGCSSVHAESTNTVRTIGSAKATLSAMVPGCAIDVEADLKQDPASIDRKRLTDAVNGRFANQPAWFEHAFSVPLGEMHSILSSCNRGGANCKSNTPDFRATMLESGGPAMSMMSQPHATSPGTLAPRDSRKESAVALGADFAENFLLQYVEGMPMEQVGWGRVSRATLDRLMEMNTRYHDFILRTPYYAQQAAGPLAQHIGTWFQTMNVPIGTGRPDVPQKPGAKALFLSAHDANLTWMGGLLRIDWLVSDETFNSTPPGSALVFELHHSTQTNEDTVRVLFIAQTLDQIRNLTPLTGEEKPSIAPVYVPDCSGPAPSYACTLKDFVHVIELATAK